MRAFFAGLMLLTVTPALAQTAPPASPAPATQPPLVWVKSDDPAMTAAIAEARATLPDFLRHLASPAADERGFGVKFDIVPGPKNEYIWAHDIRREADGGWSGVLDDDAVLVAGFKANQRVPIAAADIVDWGYFKGQVMQGNRTTRVLLDHVDATEAAAIRRAYGW